MKIRAIAVAIGVSLAVFVAALSPLETRADTIAFSISGGSSFFPDQDASLGYVFILGSPISVTSLGLFDEGSNGLNAFYNVFISTSGGDEVAHGVIPAGTGTTLIDGFRYVSIAPVLLPAGTYKIWAFYTTDIVDNVITSAAITSASGLSYGGSTSDVGLTFPSGNFFGLSSGYFGPNFQFTAATSVPETGTTCYLLGFSLGGLAFLRRKIPA